LTISSRVSLEISRLEVRLHRVEQRVRLRGSTRDFLHRDFRVTAKGNYRFADRHHRAAGLLKQIADLKRVASRNSPALGDLRCPVGACTDVQKHPSDQTFRVRHGNRIGADDRMECFAHLHLDPELFGRPAGRLDVDHFTSTGARHTNRCARLELAET
jgi:hypothetical protein